jgi:phage terminase large subunit-like protein
MQRLEKLGEGLVAWPDDVHMAVAATRDKGMHPKGSWERWRFICGDGLPRIRSGARTIWRGCHLFNLLCFIYRYLNLY